MELNFDATQIEGADIPQDFGALPDGKYLVHIVETEERMANSGLAAIIGGALKNE